MQVITGRERAGRRCRRCRLIGSAEALAVACALTSLPASPAMAQSRIDRTSDPGEIGTPVPAWDDEITLFGTATAHVVTAPVRWSARDWLVLPAVAAGVLLVTTIDDDVRDAVQRNRAHVEDVTDAVDRLGTVENYAILGGFLVAGLITDDVKARSVAIEGVVSSVVAAGLVTPILQRVMGRDRPWTGRGAHSWHPLDGGISFPSGHTTQAFAVASVIATEYESTWVKATAYGLAGLVGASRMVNDAHFLSDVLVGALIGTLVGRSTVAFARVQRVRWALTPSTSGTGIGLALRIKH